ncbi:MAG: TetR/AcrR family transcriptional regulator [Stappiaceae bacterium]
MNAAKPAVAPVVSQTIEDILLAAEAEFAERGFEGAGMKAISVKAAVSQALLHYHFGTKERLYAEVIAQRSKKINDERNALLDQIDLTAADALDRIFEALFRPPLGPAGGERPYARIFSGLVVGRERNQALVKEHYDPTAKRFVAVLRRVIPAGDQGTAALCYSLALGSLIAMIGRDGRVERLMGRDAPLKTEEILRLLIAHAKGGALALISQT